MNNEHFRFVLVLKFQLDAFCSLNVFLQSIKLWPFLFTVGCISKCISSLSSAASSSRVDYSHRHKSNSYITTPVASLTHIALLTITVSALCYLSCASNISKSSSMFSFVHSISLSLCSTKLFLDAQYEDCHTLIQLLFIP